MEMNIGSIADGTPGRASRNNFAVLRRAFNIFYPSENFLPSPIILKFCIYDGSGWLGCGMISSKLRSMKIFYHPTEITTFDTTSAVAIISTLVTNANMLTHFDIPRVEFGRAIGILLPSVASSKYLQSFVCGCTLTPKLAAALASSTHLTQMQCSLPQHFPFPSYLQHLSGYPFPSLRYVAITAAQILSIERFLHAFMSMSPIRKLQVTVKWKDGRHSSNLHSTPLEKLGSLVGGSFGPSLTSLTLTAASGHGRVGLRQVISYSDVRPLLSCKRLERLEIMDGYLLEAFSDDALQDMATAWPQLRVLVLLPFSADLRALCTLRSLSHLARECLHLRHLTINLISQPELDPVSPAGAQEMIIPHPNLMELVLGFSAFVRTSMPVMTLFFKSVFPKAEVYCRFSGGEGRIGNMVAWSSV